MTHANITTKYYVDYVCEKTASDFITYFQLVRTIDEAILYANENLDNIFLHCFHIGIHKDDLTIL